MISAEQIPAHVRQFFSQVLFVFRREKPKPPVVPAEEPPDEFQIRQAQKLAKIAKSMEQSGTHTIPSVWLDSTKE